jgi:hypothetical protein
MQRVRQIAAMLMALSLVLPERSCVNDGRVEVGYPLSGIDFTGALMVLAIYLLPLAVLQVRRLRFAALASGICAVGAGLFFCTYVTWSLGYKLLIGWYIYTIGAVAYVVSSLPLLVQHVLAKVSRRAASGGVAH